MAAAVASGRGLGEVGSFLDDLGDLTDSPSRDGFDVPLFIFRRKLCVKVPPSTGAEGTLRSTWGSKEIRTALPLLSSDIRGDVGIACLEGSAITRSAAASESNDASSEKERKAVNGYYISVDS